MTLFVKLMTRGDKQLEFNACTNIYTHRPRQSFAGPRMLALYVNERARNLYSASSVTKLFTTVDECLAILRSWDCDIGRSHALGSCDSPQ